MNSWATQLSRDIQPDILFLCQDLEEAVFTLLPQARKLRNIPPQSRRSH
jgi:hypothetical protein